jgi:hypothetical protein
MKKGNSADFAAAYDSAGAAPAGGGDSSFAGSYDQAAAAEGTPGEEGQESPDQEAAEGELEIQPQDVQAMQALKDSGDMQGLGEYVAKLLK